MSWRAPLRNNAVSTSVPVSSGCERTFKVVLAMAYHSTVGYFLVETINRIRHLLFSSYTTNDYSSHSTVRGSQASPTYRLLQCAPAHTEYKPMAPARWLWPFRSASNKWHWHEHLAKCRQRARLFDPRQTGGWRSPPTHC